MDISCNRSLVMASVIPVIRLAALPSMQIKYFRLEGACFYRKHCIKSGIAGCKS
ncbi:MAG: hypothetical protein LBR26_00215 [Prevotella sp.]|nr:hypothetical protein [Prevotella sp.]